MLLRQSMDDVNFNLDGIDQSNTQASLTVNVQGLTLTPHNINVTFNGIQLFLYREITMT